MGIKQLFQVIKDEAPDAIINGDIKNQFGRKVAIDAYDPIYPLCEMPELNFPLDP